jgi:hypothetical protein
MNCGEDTNIQAIELNKISENLWLSLSLMSLQERPSWLTAFKGKGRGRMRKIV